MAGVSAVERIKPGLIEVEDGGGTGAADGLDHRQTLGEQQSKDLLVQLRQLRSGATRRGSGDPQHRRWTGDLHLGEGQLSMLDLPQERLPGPTGADGGLEGRKLPRVESPLDRRSERGATRLPFRKLDGANALRIEAQSRKPIERRGDHKLR